MIYKPQTLQPTAAAYELENGKDSRLVIHKSEDNYFVSFSDGV